MLDMHGNELGGPSLEKRVTELEFAVREAVSTIVKLQQAVVMLIQRAEQSSEEK